MHRQLRMTEFEATYPYLMTTEKLLESYKNKLFPQLTINILAHSDKVRMNFSQFSKSIVSWIRLCVQTHMSAITIEFPNQSRVFLEGFRRGQFSCLIGPPKSPGTSKSREGAVSFRISVCM